MAETAYIVLRHFEAEGSQGRWDRIGADTVAASSAEQAIRATVEGRTANDKSGTYVAIPARSFKPITVKAETTTVLKLESAAAPSP